MVLGYYFNAEDNAVKANAIPDPVLPKGTFAGRNVGFYQWRGYTGNLPIYLSNAAGAGHFNPKIDNDGVSRRVPMILEYEGAYYEALSLAVARNILGQPNVEPGYAPEGFFKSRGYSGLEWLKVGKARIPVDDSASALIPYRGDTAQLPLHLARRRDQGPRQARGAEGQGGAGRRLGAGPVRPALDAGRRGLSGGGDPRQPDRRHARRQHEGEALVHAGRRGGAAGGRRADARAADPDAVGGLGHARHLRSACC